MKRLMIPGLLIFIWGFSYAQKGPDFSVPEVVCVGDQVNITNMTTGDYESFYWSFCAASPFDLPSVANVALDPNPFFQPVFIALAQQQNDYFALVVNHNNTVPTPGNGYITRIDFGSDILNPAPEVTNINGMLPKNPEGIQIVNENDKWYAFVVGGKIDFGVNNGFFRRLDFGNSLSNAPSYTSLNTNNQLFFPHDLYIFKEEGPGGVWWGLTVNSGSTSHQDSIDGSVTRFAFPGGIESNPAVQNLGSFNKLKDPVGIFPIKHNNKWYVFVTDRHAGLIRLDFGGSLTNSPTAINVSTSGMLTRPRDISLMRYCDKILGFVVDGEQHGNSFLVRLDFGDNLESTPTAEKLTELGNVFNFPHSISDLIRADDQTFALVTNVGNNNISRVFFPSCEDEIPSQFYTSDVDPDPVVYNSPGTYNIELIVNEGLPDQANICKEVIVNLPTAGLELLDDTICNGDQASILVHFTGFPPWDFTYTNGVQFWDEVGITANPYSLIISPEQPTTYTITEVVDNVCVGEAAGTPVSVHVIPKDDAGFSFPSGTFCKNSSPVIPVVNLEGGVFTAGPPGLVIDQATGEIIPAESNLGTYYVTYTVNMVCLNALTVQLSIVDEALANFEYAQPGYCLNGVNPMPEYPANAGPGVFSTSSEGLILDQLSGEITLNGSLPGVYMVYNEILPGSGCPYEIDSAQVVIYHLPAPEYLSDTVCLGAPTSLWDISTIEEGSIVGWNWFHDDIEIGQGNEIQYVFQEPGLHDIKLLITSDNACTLDTTMQVYVKDLPAIDLVRRIPAGQLVMSGDTLFACVYNSVTLDAGDPDNPERSFQWSVGADSDTLTIGALGIGYELQYHEVIVTDLITGCINTARIFIEFSIVPCEIGIFEPDLNANIRIYPNPATHQVTIEIDNAEHVNSLQFVNMLGETISMYELLHEKQEHTFNIPLQEINPGIYLVRIIGNGFYGTYKVIVSSKGE
jgi:hypothetical protein